MSKDGWVGVIKGGGGLLKGGGAGMNIKKRRGEGVLLFV